jgi:hypothetical protein
MPSLLPREFSLKSEITMLDILFNVLTDMNRNGTLFTGREE